MNSQCIIAWIYLIVAGIFEILWAIGMKYSDRFTKLWSTIATLIAMALSILLLRRTVKVLPIGTA